MGENETEFYELNRIANWQLDDKNADVELPSLQRGYVWKPKQVETLWDSLLRGYPIGSFLVSEGESRESKRHLLDGQQRATAIAFGFHNPWENNRHPNFYSKKFKEKPEETIPILWLDMAFKQEVGDFIFLPRLITQSHPWGFNSNSAPIGVSSRREAAKEFNKNAGEYPHYNLKNVYPWDAELPVPLVFLIDSYNASRERWREILAEKCREHLFHITADYGYNEGNATSYINKLLFVLNDSNICDKIEMGIKTILEIKIPIITLTNKLLIEESRSATQDAATLFIRINTAGTPLTGEELIYSMYKTVFPKSKEIVEEAGAGFIAPSRIITLIGRIVSTDISLNKQQFKFANQLNFKQFKNEISDKEGAFYLGMRRFAEDEKALKTLFDNAKYILIGEKDFQLPVPLAVDIARGNTDVLFILLYWIHFSNLTIDDILKDESLHKKILAAITTLNWFCLDTNRFLNELAKNEMDFTNMGFWNSRLFRIQEPIEDRYLTYIPNPDYLRITLAKRVNNTWEDIFLEEEQKKVEFLGFFNRLNWQRALLLYAQRHYIDARFKQLQWDTLLEDTNRPYDYDHIYPDSAWTRHIPNYSPITKEWRWSIGNFRVLALEDNRAEGARFFPKQRLENTRDISFISNDNWNYWEKIDSDINEAQLETLALAIINRVADIYEEWYIKLAVVDLVQA